MLRNVAMTPEPAPGPGYDSGKTRDLLDVLGFEPQIAAEGQPAPIQAGRQALARRTHPLVDERLRQAAPVRRQTQDHRRVSTSTSLPASS